MSIVDLYTLETGPDRAVRLFWRQFVFFRHITTALSWSKHRSLKIRFRCWLARLAVTAVFVHAVAFETQAADRVALVMGNGDYVHSTSLPNPVNDATDVSNLLRQLGFSVTTVLNGTYEDIRQAIRSFNIQVQGADIGLIYYAGHGMELAGENWLIPVDADLKSDLDVANSAISLKTIMQSVSRANGLGLVILDACRDNPFSSRMEHSKLTRSVERGFARVEPTTNVLVAYAAKDGTTAKDGDGRNSPYTAALLRNLNRPGLEVGRMFRNVRDDVMASSNRQQEPFIYGSLSSRAFYLNGNATPSALSVDTQVSSKPKEEAEAVWIAIRESADADLFEQYLIKFPDGRHSIEAHERLSRLRLASECDRLAKSLSDRDQTRTAAAAKGKDSAPHPAKDACEQAAKEFPDAARYAFEAGRVSEAQKDYPRAQQHYEKAVVLGSAPAAFRLGLLSSESDRLPMNYAKAREWFEKAADQNISAAMFNLGLLYETGRGGPQDYSKAYEMYAKAAANGDRRAMRNLGSAYETGHGAPQDYGESMRWYKKAADLGDWDAMISIGKLYERGLGVAKSRPAAREWYEKASEAKSAERKAH
jgi:uncharacterized protein